MNVTSDQLSPFPLFSLYTLQQAAITREEHIQLTIWLPNNKTSNLQSIGLWQSRVHRFGQMPNTFTSFHTMKSPSFPRLQPSIFMLFARHMQSSFIMRRRWCSPVTYTQSRHWRNIVRASRDYYWIPVTSTFLPNCYEKCEIKMLPAQTHFVSKPLNYLSQQRARLRLEQHLVLFLESPFHIVSCATCIHIYVQTIAPYSENMYTCSSTRG